MIMPKFNNKFAHRINQRFSLRKISIGLVSVLLGTTIYLSQTTNTAHAETITDPAVTQTDSQQTTDTETNQAKTATDNSAAISSFKLDQPQTATNKTAPADTVNNAPESSKTADTNQVATNNNQNNKLKSDPETPSDYTDTWNNVQIDYNNATQTLKVHGGKMSDPKPLAGNAKYTDQIKQIDIIDKITLSGDAINMFGDLPNLTTITGLENLDTKYVTSMKSMFANDPKLTSLDLSSWDTSSCLSMSSMFKQDSSLTSLNLKGFNTSKTEFMQNMFQGTGQLGEIDVSSFDTSRVKDMSYMFADMSNLSALNLANFTVDNVEFFMHTFNNDTALTSLDLSNFVTSSATDFSYMFNNCANLTSLNLANFDTSKAVYLNDMFNNVAKLTELDLSHFDVGNAKTLSNMFKNMTGLTKITLTGWNPSNALYFTHMFEGDNQLTSLDLSSFVTDNAKDLSYMFNGCTNLQSLKLDHFNTENVLYFNNMFMDDQSLTDLDLTSFKTDNAVSMNDMFHNCFKLKTLQIPNFNTGNVQYFGYMFNSARALTSLDLHGFDMSNSLDQSAMLQGLNNLDVLILGTKTKLANTGLDTPHDWMRVQGGTITKPLGKRVYTNTALVNNYQGATDADTYVKAVGQAYQVTVQYWDFDNDQLLMQESVTCYPGLISDYDVAFNKNITDLTNKNYLYSAKDTTLPFADGSHDIQAPDSNQTTNYLIGFRHKQAEFGYGEKNPYTDQTEDENLKKTIVQTVEFKNTPAEIKPNKAEVSFTRKGIVDLVTGKTTYTEWDQTTKTFAAVKAPSVNGYLADKSGIKETAVTADSADLNEVVTYQPAGKIICVDSQGKTLNKEQSYLTDPDDATKILSEQTVPEIAGYTAANKTVKPVDPQKDTTVTFYQNNLTTIHFVDQEKREIAKALTTSSALGKALPKPKEVAQVLADLAKNGYELVTDPFNTNPVAQEGNQDLYYIFKHAQSAVTDTKTQKYIVHFVDSNGQELSAPVSQDITFTRTGQKDAITNEIVWGTWQAQTKAQAVNVPVVTGYISQIKTVPETTITQDTDTNVNVAYSKLGNFIPVDENGQEIANQQKQYQNDATDPTKIATKQKLPEIPGYTLKEAVTPQDPTKDTKVVYLADNVTQIHFIDQDNQNQAIPDVDPVTLNNTKIGQALTEPETIADVIKKLHNQGYDLVTNPFSDHPVAQAGKQDLNYVFKHQQETVTDTQTQKLITHFIDTSQPDENGFDGYRELAQPDVQEVKFTRAGLKDVVTGEITWTSEFPTSVVAQSGKAPIVNGYFADVAQSIDKQVFLGKDTENSIRYQRTGRIIPVDENGKEIPLKQEYYYTSGPDDATQVPIKQNTPDIAGYTTKDKTVTISDPTDPTKSTKVVYTKNPDPTPVVPKPPVNNPGIPVTVETNELKVIVHDQDSKQDLSQYHWQSGKVNEGDKVTYDWTKIKQDLINHGYEIVNEPVIPSSYQAGKQQIVIQVKHQIVTVSPQKPQISGNKINQGTAVWPDLNNYQHDRQLVINFISQKNKILAPAKAQTITFGRELQIDAVTGKILNPDAAWQPLKPAYQAVKVPKINGYRVLSTTANGIKLQNGFYPSQKAIDQDLDDNVIYVLNDTDKHQIDTEKPHAANGQKPASQAEHGQVTNISHTNNFKQTKQLSSQKTNAEKTAVKKSSMLPQTGSSSQSLALAALGASLLLIAIGFSQNKKQDN